jgi:tRNA uridine 5-carboxymethylaminomethyl modification enzyme
VEILVKYEGYLNRQAAEVAKVKELDERLIPEGFDFAGIPSMRLEARQKLTQIQPRTIGQAARISGVSPADISLLLVSMRRGQKKA